MTFDFTDDGFGTCFGVRQGAFRFQFPLENAEVGEHLLDRLVTFITVVAQSLLQNGFEFQWNIRQYAGQRWWLRCQDGGNAVARRFAVERRTSSHNFVEHYAQAPNIRARIYLLAARLFRRHVTRRA